MDDDNRDEVEQNRLTADLRAFITDNMTAGDIQGLAFEIGIDPNELGGALAGALAVSLIHIMAQRSELHLLDTALRDEFLALFKQATDGEDWQDYRNDELVVDSLIPGIAHQLYPTLFKTGTSFTTETSEIVVFTNDRVREMLEIAREASGKDYIVFIIDEVGQYVGPRPNLILNLDGLAKNLKNIGDGKVWIVGTAQQTLTEDDAKAALNSPELFK